MVWLTARKIHLKAVTIDWLTRNGFVIDDLIFVDYFADKIAHLIEIEPVLFVDDLKYDYFSLKPKKAFFGFRLK